MKQKRFLNSKLIREKLAEKNMTQTELAKKIGVSHSSVAHYLYGNNAPSLSNLQKLSDVLEIPLNLLVVNSDGSIPISDAMAFELQLHVFCGRLLGRLDGSSLANKEEFAKMVKQLEKDFLEESK